MRLGEEPGPINQDARDQILRDIKYGRDLQADIQHKVSTIPAGRPTAPFEGDQAAYEAALKAFKDTDPGVVALEKRLTEVPGPYWRDLSIQERETLALWTESLKQMDKITSAHYPTGLEVDTKKLILLAIAAGSFIAPLLFTKEEKSGFPFSLLPKLPDVPFERAPMRLPQPVRPEVQALPLRMSPGLPAPVETPRSIVQSTGVPSVVERSGYASPPRFSRSFSTQSSAPTGASSPIQRASSAIPQRSEGERRYIYPKPRTT